MASGILVPRLMSPAGEVQNLNHWTVREVNIELFLNRSLYVVPLRPVTWYTLCAGTRGSDQA